jgi:hypothetical protein
MTLKKSARVAVLPLKLQPDGAHLLRSNAHALIAAAAGHCKVDNDQVCTDRHSLVPAGPMHTSSSLLRMFADRQVNAAAVDIAMSQAIDFVQQSKMG